MHKLSALLIAIPAITIAAAAFASNDNQDSTANPVALQNASKAGYNAFAAQELDTARNSAESARTAKDITGVHEHLQAVINCLVGPQGPGFVTTIDNPCKRMGHGALHDVMQNSDESRLLNDALDEAKDGLASTSIDSAHSSAKDVFNDIDNAENSAKQ
jgi:hypothetical protein